MLFKDKEIDEFCFLSVEGIKMGSNIRSEYNDEKINELAESIKQYGQLQPIRVYFEEKDYYIIFGHRRFLACKKAGLNSIYCIVTQKPDSAESIFLQIVENEQKENISSADLEKYISLLKTEHKYSVAEIAQKLNKTESYIYRIIKAAGTREEHEEIFTKTGFDPTTNDLMILNNFSKEEIHEAVDSICENPGKKTKIIKELKQKHQNKTRNNTKSKELKKEINDESNDVINYEINLRISKNDIDKTIIVSPSNISRNIDSNLMSAIAESIKKYFENIGYMINE